MKYTDYVDLKYKPKKTDLICEFYMEPASKIKPHEAAGAIASESSIGTWTDVTEAPKRIDRLVAKVFSIKGNKGYYIKIAYPSVLFELNNIPQILSSIAGNIFGMKTIKNLKLLDIEFPENIIKSFRGPMYGIYGVRKLLKVKDRPLLGTIIKPKLGLNEKEHAQVAYNAWIGGCDIVKDDENLSSQSFNKFLTRVIETLKARDKAEEKTGEKKMYMPNITAETEEMLRRARFVKKHGCEYAMIDIVSCGWGALQTLREENEKLKLVLHAHRAGYAALSRNPRHGISMLVIAKLTRLIGLDQLHIGTIVGKMETPKTEVVGLDQEMEQSMILDHRLESRHMLEQRWYHIKPTFAVCSGGLHPGHISYLVKHLGKNIIIQMGGGIHGHPLGTFGGAKAARQALTAVMEGKTLKNYAKTHIELKKALEFF
ncbi:MAG: type III ribulose-bisphosphate carboxylase [Candidatus Pacearchaeota archaeon]|nr:MAG: type III ribulose-bisphosphate carboxylase [Candidatus Pacearchaeota archaeon]